MFAIPPTTRKVLAEELELNEQYLYQCFTRRRQLPADRCPAVERAMRGEVTCDQLRPDVRWVRVPDPTWPHPDGRPCIDVAGPGTADEEVRHAA